MPIINCRGVARAHLRRAPSGKPNNRAFVCGGVGWGKVGGDDECALRRACMQHCMCVYDVMHVYMYICIYLCIMLTGTGM